LVTRARLLWRGKTAKHPVKKGDWDDVSIDIVIFSSHSTNKIASDKKACKFHIKRLNNDFIQCIFGAHNV
jgi:hypothetical protein